MYESKIKTLEEIKSIAQDLHRQNRKIVHCHGCFDFLHVDHIAHFHDAKKEGDVLIVTVTPDRFVNKGPGRPYFNETLRLRTIAALQIVDFVVLNDEETAVKAIGIIKPSIYAKAKETLNNVAIDRTNLNGKNESNFGLEVEEVTKHGGKLLLTETGTFSSSTIINELGLSFTPEVRTFLHELKKQYTYEKILETLKQLSTTRVLVMGDVIFDDYVYCSQLGRAGKEPLIGYRFLSSERHLGGVLSIANTLAGFSNKVTLLTALDKRYLPLVTNKLNASITQKLLTQYYAKTMIKRRYIDQYRNSKSFEVYNVEHSDIEKETEKKILAFLKTNISSFDMVLVSDFGHGFMSQAIIDFLVKNKIFLAVNCQLNAGNRGYNFITKYKRANFISLNEQEIRLPFQARTQNIETVMKQLTQTSHCSHINVTLGKAGSIYFHEGTFYRAPSFNQSPKDTMGAGDAVLSLTALLAQHNVSPQLVPFLGNIIGSLAVQIIGHTTAPSITQVDRMMRHMLK